jgi:hypothetical protein
LNKEQRTRNNEQGTANGDIGCPMSKLVFDSSSL